jgi:HD-GYP domain-containing protein (c-di-GMP phosphodiesterase class II)
MRERKALTTRPPRPGWNRPGGPRENESRADALDSMLTTRIYRAARPAPEALEELRRGSGSQFCPRCVGALERLLQGEQLQQEQREQSLYVAIPA